MIQSKWDTFIGHVASVTEVYRQIIAFYESNPVAANVFALTVAAPFVVVLIFNIIHNLKCRDVKSDN